MTKITAAEKPVAKVLNGDYQFEIPDYQRPYAWTAEEALKLVDDLEATLDAGRDAVPYFLGSLVLVRNPESKVAQVIDGQQRLTTLTLIFAVMRHLHLDDKVDASLTRLIEQEGDVLAREEAMPRLRLRKRDREFFRRQVQEPSTLEALLGLNEHALDTDAKRNIVRNARVLVKRLSSWSQDRIQSFASLLMLDTYLVIVETQNTLSAHRIFSVMNSRGLDLSPADIFKSDVIGAVHIDRQEEYAEKWENAEELVGRRSFEDLFLHMRMIVAKVRATRALLEEFRTQVLDGQKWLPDRAAAFVDEMVGPYATALSIVENADYAAAEGADAVNRVLRRLGRLENNDWKPVALWLVRHLLDEPEALAMHLDALDRLAASMVLRRTYSTPRAQRYGTVLRELEAGEGLAAFELSDDERREAMSVLRGPIYEQAEVRKLALVRLNELLASTEVQFEHSVLTVEHVLPQTPKADSRWLELFDETARERWTHRLGNLVLLDRKKNAEAQNYEFDVKKDRYFRSRSGVSPFQITTTVLTTTDWTPEVVADRQRTYVRRLAEAWGIDHTNDGDDLVEIAPEELAPTRSVGRRSVDTRPRPKLSDLLAVGAVEAGETLVWHRPHVGDRHEATVEPDGSLRLTDGRTFSTPSGAASAASNASENGWAAWRTADGRALGDLLAEHTEDPRLVNETSERWQLMDRITAAIPAGAWTAYGDLALAIGTHARPVGTRIATNSGPNFWRVLRSDGSVADGFTWGAQSEHEGRDQADVLASEGVRIEGGVADPTQRLDANALRTLVGLDAVEVAQRDERVLEGLASEFGVSPKTFRWWLRRDGWAELAKRNGRWVLEPIAEELRSRYAKGAST